MANNIQYRIRKDVYDNGDEDYISEWKYSHDEQWFKIEVGAAAANPTEAWARQQIANHKRTYRTKISEVIVHEE